MKNIIPLIFLIVLMSCGTYYKTQLTKAKEGFYINSKGDTLEVKNAILKRHFKDGGRFGIYVINDVIIDAKYINH
jgi:hypothetical protein